jgi:hypothetical protein
MAPQVTVLIPSYPTLHRDGLASLDRQTLSPRDLEIVVLQPVEVAAAERLARLVAHRTNMRVVPATGDSPVASLLAAAEGEYVLLLGADRTLTPEALERLCEQADKTGADVCFGLTGRRGVRPETAVSTRETGDPAADDRLRESGAGRIHRRSHLEKHTVDGQSADQLERAATAAAATVAVQSSALCFVDGDAPRSGAPAERRSSPFSLRANHVDWRDGALVVRAELTADGGASLPEVSAVTVFSTETGVEWQLDDTDVSRMSGATEDAEGVRTLEIRIDPERLAAGAPLPVGTWWPSIRLSAPAGDDVVLLETSARTAVGATCLPRPVVSFAQEKRLGLDVGGLKHPVVDRIPVPDASVVESVRGCLFTCPVPQVDVTPGATVDGQLRLGGITVPARLEGDEDGRGVLQAWVSGMSGSHRMKTRFSPARFADCGARLVIDGAGAMQVKPTRAKRRKKSTRAGAAAAVEPTAGSAVARLRSQAGRVRRALVRRLRRG